jgi:hypothetical protein
MPRSGQDEYHSLPACLSNPADCPIRTNGNDNFLILYVNGMEEDACPGLNSCDATWGFRLTAPTTRAFLNTLYTGEAGIGYDQVNLNLAGRVRPNVEYSLEQFNRHPAAYDFDSQSGVKFILGPRN